jgi:hypothetical protein
MSGRSRLIHEGKGLETMDAEIWLAQLIKEVGAVAGTVHYRSGETLELRAAVNIPEKVRLITQQIPKGKGMAGLAWERGKPVQTCNLQDDKSGDVRPGAKAVDAKAAIAIPIETSSGEVLAVVGVAFMSEGELPAEEVARITAKAKTLPL